MPSIRRSYVAVLVTLTNANTNYKLIDLVNAIIQNEGGAAAFQEAPGMVREVTMQAYAGIDGVGGNSNDVLVGDALLSATRFGYVLVHAAPGGTYSDRSNLQNVDVSSLYVRSAGAGQKISVQLKA